ncbi:MAG: hypothetical protein WD379_10530 [Dehalococcoidia bacterium]
MDKGVQDELDIVRPGRTAAPEKYLGSTWLANTLFVLGWVTLVGALIGGVVYAATFECGSFDSDCNETDGAVGMIAILLVGFLYTILTWVLAYVLRLLIDVEMNTARQAILLRRLLRRFSQEPQEGSHE